MIIPSSPLWMAAGWTMLHLVWAGTLIGVLAAICRLALRSAGPETRYAVALAALLLLVLSPVAVFAAIYEPPATINVPASPLAATLAPAIRDASRSSPRIPDRHGLVAPHPPAAPSRVESLVPYLPWLWMAGSLSTFALLAAGLVGVEGLRRSAQPLEGGPIAVLVRELAISLGIAQRVAVGVCDRIASPVLIGIVRPMILLPRRLWESGGSIKSR